jgi:predicted RNA-binding Zn ribbon-like protein
VDLTTYAELAVRLVNTASYSEDNVDRLATMDGLHDLVADREHLSSSGATRRDLEALRGLRTEFRKVFAACAAGDGDEAAARLNSLLIRHPVHPQLSRHDGQHWHVHFTESGTVADQYAAGAAMGLAVRLTELGLERSGVCQAPPCQGVFIDTSTNRSRRYCSKRCLNRANVTAFRTRQRGASTGTETEQTADG